MYPQYKLLEAQFFFKQLETYRQGTVEYAYIFSAFVSAFRSVTFSIQSMYKHRSDFEQEYSKLIFDLGKYPISKELVEARNIVLKEGAKIPRLIITTTNNETGDRIIFECDPIDTSTDGVRKIELVPAFREEWCYPPGTTNEEKKKIVVEQCIDLLAQHSQSKSTETNYSMRLIPDGMELSPEEFHAILSEIINTVETHLTHFKMIWPLNEFWKPLGNNELPK